MRWEDEKSVHLVPVKSNWSMRPAASKCRPATPRIQTSSARSTRMRMPRPSPRRTRRDAERPTFDAWQHLPSRSSASASSRIIGARFASKLGVTSDVLEPPRAPRDMTVEISATLAHEVAQYLERNCPLPGVQEICAVLKIVATTACAPSTHETLLLRQSYSLPSSNRYPPAGQSGHQAAARRPE